MKKVLLVLASTIERSPYVNIYRSIFDKYNVEYEIVEWDRFGEVEDEQENSYVCKNRISRNTFLKIWGYLKYIQYIKRHLKSHKYDVAVLFTIPIHILTYCLIKQSIPYMCDIRDYSRVYNYPFIPCVYSSIISKSLLVLISSAGFLSWLPKYDKYVVSHNMSCDMVALAAKRLCRDDDVDDKIKILTIGQIRDYSTNIRLIRELANINSFRIDFVGIGDDYDKLKKFVQVSDISNVSFRGRYSKCDEMNIVEQYNMINILSDDDINSRSLMSNRFYLSVLLKKPVIVSANTFQAQLVEKYALGIVVQDMNDLSQQILDYFNTFDRSAFQMSCDMLLDEFKLDLLSFEKNIILSLKL